MNISCVYVRKGLRGRPDQLGYVNFSRREQADDHAGENRGQQNVATRVFSFLGERRNSVKADVSQHRYRSTAEDSSGAPIGRIVKRTREECSTVVRVSKNVTR